MTTANDKMANSNRRLAWSIGTALICLACLTFLLFSLTTTSAKTLVAARGNHTSDAITTTYPVGPYPWGIAFDGQNMWVAIRNHGSGNSYVNVLRASDGYPVMTPTVGAYPFDVAYDGTYMWVTNNLSNTVSVIRASDGFVSATIPVGNNPRGIAFDGTRMWIANNVSQTVSEINASTGSLSATYPISDPWGVAFDGTNMWVSDVLNGQVVVFRPSDGDRVMTLTVGNAPVGMAFDGKNVWVANSNTVNVIRASDGFYVMTPTVGGVIRSIAFDGVNMWLPDYGSGAGITVTVLRASDGALVRTVAIGQGSLGIAFDGENMWITNSSDNTVTKVRAIYRNFLPLMLKQPATPPTPSWLDYVNYYRAIANLLPVTENPAWSDSDWKHSRYMVKNDYLGHDEDPSNPWYTPEGQTAAQNGNTMVSSSSTATDSYAIDFWMRGPFHAVRILDPALFQVGFGSYREADGGWQMGATLDVIRGLGTIPSSVSFPIEYPGDGRTIGLRSYTGGEWPDPLSSCPGYATPSGLPIILQIGPGNLVPSVTAHSFKQGSTALEHCIFDETNYVNPDSYTQGVGRGVLSSRDAIVLVPRSPLTAGATYTVSITTNSQTYTWAFTVSSTVNADEFTGSALMR
jgi:YVTN family beta-propeller protein